MILVSGEPFLFRRLLGFLIRVSYTYKFEVESKASTELMFKPHSMRRVARRVCMVPALRGQHAISDHGMRALEPCGTGSVRMCDSSAVIHTSATALLADKSFSS